MSSLVATGFLIYGKAGAQNVPAGIIVIRANPDEMGRALNATADAMADAMAQTGAQARSAAELTDLANSSVQAARDADPTLGLVKVVGSAAFGTAVGVALTPLITPVGGFVAGYFAGKAYDALFDAAREHSEDYSSDLADSWLLDGLVDAGLGFKVLLEKLRAIFDLAEGQASPIILDLDRDGVVETTPRDAAGTRVFFDLDNSGYAERSGWVGADDGLLVRDLNANGEIDSGAELFGNHTKLGDGTRASNGFEALAELDTNRDGVINSYDAEAFASLRVWKDANGDGQTNEGELLTIEQAGVQALNGGYTDHGTRTPLDAQGNQHRQTGSYILAADGSIRSMNDVWFSVQPGETVDLNPVQVSAAIASLPDWAGMGNLPSLHQAMARDSSGELKALIEQWISAGPQARDALLGQIIYHWADVENVALNSRGVHLSDARKLYALEKALGERYEQGGWGASPGPDASAVLNDAFKMLKVHLNGQLQLQTDLKPVLDSIELLWSASNGEFEVTVSETVNLLRQGYAENSDEGLQTVATIGRYLSTAGAFADQVLAALRVAGQSETGAFGLSLELIGYSAVMGNAFQYSQVQSGQQIESVEFSDRTVWRISDLMERLVHHGSVSNDTLNGLASYSNRLRGLAGIPVAKAQHQVIRVKHPTARQLCRAWCDACAHLQYIFTDSAQGVGMDDVLAVSLVEDIDVDTCPTRERVIAQAACQGVGTAAAIEGVVARTAIDQIGLGAASQRVVASQARHSIGLFAQACQPVVAGGASRLQFRHQSVQVPCRDAVGKLHFFDNLR